MKTVVTVLVVFGLIDLYVFKGLATLTISNGMGNANAIIKWTYWLVSISCMGLLIYGLLNRNSFNNSNTLTLIIGVFLTFFVPKLIFLAFHALDDIVNLITYVFNRYSETDFSRRNFITNLGMIAGSMMFGGMLYGIIWGKFNFRILKETIASSKIPLDFDGLKIVQISDAHLGSFGNQFEPVEKAITMINKLDADYIFFTGDLVNNHAKEAEHWIKVFAKIKAKHGKFSVFGNHDYADYGNFTPQEKAASVARLKQIHHEMGFRLLEDEHVVLRKGAAAITVIGVHNWGQGFHQKGNLSKALEGTLPGHFQILLSHDPTHFEFQVIGHTNIDLTLSGHTHGMQMGIEIPALGIKWSPVRFRYPRWAGLYEEQGQRIYINRGFGVLAYPGRVGMAPEITLLTLRNQS